MATKAVAYDRWENETKMYEPKSMQVINISEHWYLDLKYYLSTGDIPAGLDPWKQRALPLKSSRYQLVSGIMFQKKFNNVLLRCLEK